MPHTDERKPFVKQLHTDPHFLTPISGDDLLENG